MPLKEYSVLVGIRFACTSFSLYTLCLVSSNLTANKLFTINPRAVTGPPKMSLQLEVESTSALIIEPRLILVTYTDDLGGYITFNQQGNRTV